jgi:hypothetical protein
MVHCSVYKQELALHTGICVSSEWSHLMIASSLLMALKNTLQLLQMVWQVVISYLGYKSILAKQTKQTSKDSHKHLSLLLGQRLILQAKQHPCWYIGSVTAWQAHMAGLPEHNQLPCHVEVSHASHTSTTGWSHERGLTLCRAFSKSVERRWHCWGDTG